jgi:hypothetical protein
MCCLLSQQALSESYQFKQVVRGLSSTASNAGPSQAEKESAWEQFAQENGLPVVEGWGRVEWES